MFFEKYFANPINYRFNRRTLLLYICRPENNEEPIVLPTDKLHYNIYFPEVLMHTLHILFYERGRIT